MTRVALALVAGIVLMAPLRAQQPCQGPSALATLTVAERTYAEVRATAFNERLFLWIPEIQSSAGGRFTAFPLWLIEGVYGRPFPRASGPLDQASFDRLRKSTNVRATPVSVSGPRRQSFTFARQTYSLDVTRINTAPGGTDAVTVSVCR